VLLATNGLLDGIREGRKSSNDETLFGLGGVGTTGGFGSGACTTAVPAPPTIGAVGLLIEIEAMTTSARPSSATSRGRSGWEVCMEELVKRPVELALGTSISPMGIAGRAE